MYACGNTPRLNDVVAWDRSCWKIGGLALNLSEEYRVLAIDYYQDHPNPTLHIGYDSYVWNLIDKGRSYPANKLRLIRRANDEPNWLIDAWMMRYRLDIISNFIQEIKHDE